MPDAGILVSVVVPTWNRASLLRDCVESLYAQDFPVDCYEIIVADDGSTDSSRQLVTEVTQGRSGPLLRYLSLPKRGGNAARNAGMREAAGDIVSFIDDDEMVQPSHVRTVLGLLESESGLDGVGGPYRGYPTKRIRTCARCVPGAADFPGSGRRLVPWLFGGNMALRKSIFTVRGPFDESLSGYQEYEWFSRGPVLRLLYDPDLWVWHRRDQQTLRQLCRSAWNQGRAFPRLTASMGRHEQPSMLRLLRYLGHGLLRRCSMGPVLASREAGALHAAGAMKLKGRS